MTPLENLAVAAIALVAGMAGGYFRDYVGARRREAEGRRLLKQIGKAKLQHRRDMELRAQADRLLVNSKRLEEIAAQAARRREEHSRLLRQDLEESQP